jgi:RNAse (barnase) inhibitor barstar
MTKPILEIDGGHFNDSKGFYWEVSERLFPGTDWHGNLNAFHDFLHEAVYGDFGTPEGGFTLRWVNSERSRDVLGPLFDEVVELIETHCREEEDDRVELELA